jgi:hypothetical protein
MVRLSDSVARTGKEMNGENGGGSVKKSEDFLYFSVDLIEIAGFMLNQRKNDRSSSP